MHSLLKPPYKYALIAPLTHTVLVGIVAIYIAIGLYRGFTDSIMIWNIFVLIDFPSEFIIRSLTGGLLEYISDITDNFYVENFLLPFLYFSICGGIQYYTLVLLILATINWLSPNEQSGTCPECGYDLRGNRDKGCPECGWHRKKRNTKIK